MDWLFFIKILAKSCHHPAFFIEFQFFMQFLNFRLPIRYLACRPLDHSDTLVKANHLSRGYMLFRGRIIKPTCGMLSTTNSCEIFKRQPERFSFRKVFSLTELQNGLPPLFVSHSLACF